ncbi:hypothetical protein Goari_023538 [Gossypium aridum]|uniref:Uncharacterized protein n=1 Tax=Gossypium aridum TaxID=34290 RepID=A0A7J8X4L5_GOSAI|nr:hypothetical protein [Gossypium aridum]
MRALMWAKAVQEESQF